MEYFIIFLTAASLLVMFINLPVYFILLYRLISYLKNNFQSNWKELGGFGLLMNNSISSGSSTMRFILNKNYLKLNDDELARRGNACRHSLIIGLLSFAVGVIGLFAV